LFLLFFFRSRESAPSHRMNALPLPPLRLPPPTRAHLQKRSHHRLTPPPPLFAPPPPPHPGATVATTPYQGARAFLLYPSSATPRQAAPQIQNVTSSSARHPRRRSKASSRSRAALAPSALQAIRGWLVFLLYPSSAASKWAAPPIQNLASSSARHPRRRSRPRHRHLLPPRRTTSFLPAAFRNNARPAGPRFRERPNPAPSPSPKILTSSVRSSYSRIPLCLRCRRRAVIVRICSYHPHPDQDDVSGN
jgi:hypothetical protein